MAHKLFNLAVLAVVAAICLTSGEARPSSQTYTELSSNSATSSGDQSLTNQENGEVNVTGDNTGFTQGIENSNNVQTMEPPSDPPAPEDCPAPTPPPPTDDCPEPTPPPPADDCPEPTPPPPDSC